MKIILYSILLFSSFALAESNPFDGSHRGFVDGESTKIHYFDIVQNIDIQQLNEHSKKLHLEALNIISGNLTKEDKLHYIQAFPSEFDVFLSVFHPADFKQLYDGHIYIGALSKMTPEFPREIGRILIHLSSKACLDGDASNYLRHELEAFETEHPSVYKELYESTSQSGRSNIEAFKSASIYDVGPGVCRF